MPVTRSRTVTGALVAALALGVTGLTLAPGAAPRAAGAELVAFAGCDGLLAHYRDELARTATPWGFGGGYPFAVAETAAADTAAPATGRSAAVGPGATGTNLQEAGVDEPDSVKTVDGLLYAVAQGRLQIVRTGAEPTLLSSLALGDGETGSGSGSGDAVPFGDAMPFADAMPFGGMPFGGELLVQGDRVLVLLAGSSATGGPADMRSIMPALPSSTRLVLVDVADPSAPVVLEQLELDGRSLSARLSDGAVRLVTVSTPATVGVQAAEPYGRAEEARALEANRQAARETGLSSVLPQRVHRDAAGDVLAQGPAVDCADVRHAAQPQGVSTLLVTTLDLTRGLGALDSTAVTTDGELVYASADRLYVATSRWGTTTPAGDAVVDSSGEVTTELHGFDTTSPDRTPYVGSGSVQGYVLGRWALSSFEGHLRVATTSAPPWGAGPPTSSSVTVLAETTGGLTRTGSVGGLGVSEQIYAVRYFGDLATVVTFRQTDPLYVLDLADPAAPRLLGELKVPGFSTYLHPVGGDRLLGVGQDADDQGRTTGVQVSLFDLSDLSAPVQLDRLSLGEGYTPAGDDSRAFGFDVASSTALLPFTRWTATGATSSALAIAVGDDGTLSLSGRLDVAADSGMSVDRVLHDAAGVYAVTAEGLVAATSGALAPTGMLTFDR